MKITDKMRLDWLQKNGHGLYLQAPFAQFKTWVVRTFENRSLRQAIDSAIRAERWTGKLRFK